MIDLRLPAKTTDGKKLGYSTQFHCLDVGYVSLYIWDNVIGEKSKEIILKSFQISNTEFRKFLGFYNAFHDVGKITPQFVFGRLKIQESDLPEYFMKSLCYNDKIYHQMASARLFVNQCDEIIEDAREALSVIISWHHGNPSTPCSNYKQRDLCGDRPKNATIAWKKQQKELIEFLKNHWDVDLSKIKYPKNQVHYLVLAKLMVISDWIASGLIEHKEYDSIQEYLENVNEVVKEAVNKAGFKKQVFNKNLTFQELFGNNPLPAQKLAFEQIGKISEPSLIPIEDSAGSGKTALCCYLGLLLLNKFGHESFEFALPTCATTGKMYGRLKEFFEKFANTIAAEAHGMAPRFNPDDKETYSSLLAWIGNSNKRKMLSSVVVCTIDQLLYGAIQSKYSFLRLPFNAVVIIDEVHAYELYTNSIVSKLVKYLKALGCTIIMSSATLPSKKKVEFARIFNPKYKENDAAEYPRMTVINESQCFSINLGKGKQKTIDYKIVSKSEYMQAIKMADQGAIVKVFVTSVGRCQEVQKRLEIAADGRFPVKILHSNFPKEIDTHVSSDLGGPFSSRREIEENLVKQYGPNVPKEVRYPNNKGAIFVATQAAGESLDTDFDVLFSDLCPNDILLQRLGRLHRFELKYNRPKGFENPVAYIMCDETNMFPDHGTDTWVYHEYILNASYLTILGNNNKINLPEDYDKLVNAIYSTNFNDFCKKFPKLSNKLKTELRKQYYEMQEEQNIDLQQSVSTQIPEPNSPKLLEKIVSEVELDAEMGEEGFGYNPHAVSRKAVVPSYRVLFLKKISNKPQIKWITPNNKILYKREITGNWHIINDGNDELLSTNNFHLIQECAANVRGWDLNNIATSSFWKKANILPIFVFNNDKTWSKIEGSYRYTLDPKRGVIKDKMEKI